MLSLIPKLSNEVRVIIEFSNSDAISYIASCQYQEKYGVAKESIIDVNSQKEFTRAKSAIKTLPLLGRNWLINVSTSIGLAEIKKYLKSISYNALVVIHTSRYAEYKELSNFPNVKTQPMLCSSLYFGRLRAEDITALYKYYMRGKDIEKDGLNYKLLQYVKKNYQFEPDALCDLFTQVRAGNVPNSEGEVIKIIGVGGNTPQALVIGLLLTSTKTDRGRKALLKKNLVLLNDLSMKYTYSSIFNFMCDTLRGIMEIKELQLIGNYRSWGKEIPDTYNMKRISRLRRFEWVILNKISLRRVICLYNCLTKYKGYNIESNLLRGICLYTSLIGR